jgi:hypothetical protein
MLSMPQTQALVELADHLYSFLPASGARYTFREAAQEAGVGDLWVHGQGISKTSAVPAFLKAVYQQRLGLFDKTIKQIVQGGIGYRQRKQNPLTLEDIEKLNALLLRLQRKIPELWDPEFLKGLPSAVVRKATAAPAPDPEKERALEAKRKHRERIATLKQRFLELEASPDRQTAGYGLEHLFFDLFQLFELKPKPPYRLPGEQIDLAFRCDGEDYLLESRLRKDPAQPKDLRDFKGKVESKSSFTRGVFFSAYGFSPDAAEVLKTGYEKRIVLMDGGHLMRVLEGQLNLPKLIACMVTLLSTEGNPYLPLHAALEQACEPGF